MTQLSQLNVDTTVTETQEILVRKSGDKNGWVRVPISAMPTGSGGSVALADSAPLVDGTATPGTATTASRSDHRHPTDTSRAAANNTTLTGTFTQATTSAVLGANGGGVVGAVALSGATYDATSRTLTVPSGVALSGTLPVMDGTASAGTATTASRSDHRHPTDTSRAAAAHTHAVTDLTATGTRDATTFLRGDNTWANPASGGGGPSVRLAQVATGCWFPDDLAGGVANQFNCRTAHYARDRITSLQVAWANFYHENESAPGAATTVSAAIEYPVGTYIPVTFGGGSTQTIANGAMGSLSDVVAVTIPKNALFYVRSFLQNPNGVPFHSGPATTALSSAEYAASGLTSKVMGGDIALNNAVVPPALIVAQTAVPSVFILGDSIANGLGDIYDDLTNDIGIVARAISPYFPTSGYVKSGGTLLNFVNSSVNRRAAIGLYFSHIINENGFNDLGTGGMAADVVNIITAFAGLSGISSVKSYQCTITPHASSSDNFATETNQTPVNVTQRNNLNKQIIAGIPGLTGHFDVASEVEGTIYSGKFRVDLGLPTADDVHPSNNIYRAIRTSRVFEPAMIVR